MSCLQCQHRFRTVQTFLGDFNLDLVVIDQEGDLFLPGDGGGKLLIFLSLPLQPGFFFGSSKLFTGLVVLRNSEDKLRKQSPYLLAIVRVNLCFLA